MKGLRDQLYNKDLTEDPASIYNLNSIKVNMQLVIDMAK